MRPLTVTAITPEGFCAGDQWTPTLDGVLAWAHVRRRSSLDEMALTATSEMRPVDDLPIEIQRDGGMWWYSCSSPLYVASARTISHIHRRFDRSHGEKFLPDGFKRLTLATGAYKDRRIPREIIHAPSVTWHVVGDADEIRDLLASIMSIGRDVARGRGHVSEWRIAENGNEELARNYRPLPATVAKERNISGPVMRWGVAPPARITPTDCVMPCR